MKRLLIVTLTVAVLLLAGCNRGESAPRVSTRDRIEQQKVVMKTEPTPTPAPTANRELQVAGESALGFNKGLTQEQLTALERETIGPTNRNFKDPAEDETEDDTELPPWEEHANQPTQPPRGVEFVQTESVVITAFSGTENELSEIRRIFPRNGAWQNNYYIDHLGYTHVGAPALVMAIQDFIYGNAEQIAHVNFSTVKVGDVIRVKDNNDFGLFVTSVDDNSVTGIVLGSDSIVWDSAWQKSHLVELQGVLIVSR